MDVGLRHPAPYHLPLIARLMDLNACAVADTVTNNNNTVTLQKCKSGMGGGVSKVAPTESPEEIAAKKLAVACDWELSDLAKRIFNFVDKDGSGQIEIQEMLKHAGQEGVDD